MMRAIIAAWLNQSIGGIFLWLTTLYLVTGGVIHWVCFRPKWRDTVLSFNGIVPPFFVAPGIIFSLLMSFLAADVWEGNRRADRAVLDERDAVQAVHELSEMPDSGMEKLRPLVHDYLLSVLRDEWPLMPQQDEAAETTAALDALSYQAMDPAIAQKAGPALQDVLLNSVMRVATARSNRLALSEARIDRYKWSFVLLLGIIGQVGVAVVHLERQRPQLLALLVFTASAISAIGLIAVSEQPFQGARQISLAPLQNLLTSGMTAKPVH